MATYVFPNGLVLRMPDITGRVLLNITPTTFLRQLILSNPNLPSRRLTSHNVATCFGSMLCSGQYTRPEPPKTHQQIDEIVLRWTATPEWRMIRESLDKELQQPFQDPSALAINTLGSFQYDNKTFYLPIVTSNIVSNHRLNVSNFIREIKEINHPIRIVLTPQVIKAAVEQFALQRFSGAVLTLKQQFAEELSQTEGKRAMDDHAKWLASVREGRTVRNSDEANKIEIDTRQPATSQCDVTESATSGLGNPHQASGLSATSFGEPSKHQEPFTKKKARRHRSRRNLPLIPGLKLLASEAETRLIIKRGQSLYIALESAPGIPFKANDVPASYLNLFNSTATRSVFGQLERKVEALTSFDRAIVVEFENRQDLKDAKTYLPGAKFSFIDGTFSARTEDLTPSSDISKIRYALRCAGMEWKTFHEALRQIFCFTGYVAVRDIYWQGVPEASRAEIRVNAASPAWMRKFALKGYEYGDFLVEARLSGQQFPASIPEATAPGQTNPAIDPALEAQADAFLNSLIDELRGNGLFDFTAGSYTGRILPGLATLDPRKGLPTEQETGRDQDGDRMMGEASVLVVSEQRGHKRGVEESGTSVPLPEISTEDRGEEAKKRKVASRFF